MNNKEIELVNDLWQLWEDIHMAGQLVTNKDFTPKYKELKAQVEILNKHFVIVSVCECGKDHSSYELAVGTCGYCLNKINKQTEL